MSTLLANLCLDGLESCMYKNIHEKRSHKINVIRYADDFIRYYTDLPLLQK
ncbi:MAG: hypothetical protein Q9M50_07520 [Methylococcales bacterium]|nr:hypothetical protein [Methylococcales bacterium]